MNTCILRKTGRSYDTCKGILQNMEMNNVTCVQTCDGSRNADILIRWGCTACHNGQFEINTSEMIHLASDKIAARRKMIEKGIPCPRTFFSKAEALAFNRYPIIGRQRQHSQGRRITISRSANDIMNDRRSAYWSEFIPKDREFRVYTFFGRILAVSEKIPNNPRKIAWNKSLGNGVFKNLKVSELPRSVGLLALKAVHALNVDFSAVDCISKDGQAYVLEFNNSPELSPYRQLLFARAFNWAIRRIEQIGEKPKHFEVPQNEQGKMILLCRN